MGEIVVQLVPCLAYHQPPMRGRNRSIGIQPAAAVRVARPEFAALAVESALGGFAHPELTEPCDIPALEVGGSALRKDRRASARSEIQWGPATQAVRPRTIEQSDQRSRKAFVAHDRHGDPKGVASV